ncbi:MAG: asparagine synthase (glutamine-hydrolyzing) [Planctomycetaceae bacterium]
MCGIAGAVWWHASKTIDAAVLQRMTDSLRHRGPDAGGAWFSSPQHPTSTGHSVPAPPPPAPQTPGVALGHRRLSIIDLAGSAQPLGNEDQSIQIVFNGEIYNYRELRNQLLAAGHQFRTDGDTEVIVHLYEQHGLDFVRHLRGMFALAIWDSRLNQLVLARDSMGKKPLYYRLEDGRLSFASELKGLLQIPDVPRHRSNSALLQFLTLQYVPHPHCILQGFSKLPPGTLAVLEDGRLELKNWWTVPWDEPDRRTHSAADREDELRQTLTEAVRLRLESDVPLGAFLSGGIDSTIICGLMQQLLDRPARTFSIGFPVAAFDERRFARMAAEHLGTAHHEDVVTPDALGILPSLIWHYDEPFGDSSAIPTMYLAQITRQQVTVALTGDGGDELFCGYDRYRAVRAAGRIDAVPRSLRSLIASLISRIPGGVEQRSFLRRLKRLTESLAESPERRYLNWITIFNRSKLEWLAGPVLRDLLDDYDPADFIMQAWNDHPSRGFITRTTAVDTQTYLPCDILTKVDIASMAASLECRCPFLDTEVVELAARMPMRWKQTLRRSKAILVDTFKNLLPEPIRNRSKMGFGVPIDHWFRDTLQPLLRDVLLSDRSLSRGLFRPDAVRQLIDEHTSGRFNHAYRLWNLLCLELWHRMFLDQPPPADRPGVLP